MNQKARELLERLRQARLFERVGSPVSDPKVGVVKNWKEAMKRLKSKRTSNAWIDAQNMLSEELFRNHRERFNTTWNETADEARAAVKEIVMPRVTEIMEAHRLDAFFLNCIVGNFVGACHEFEYADVVPPQFHVEVVRWLLAGHFPCGWDGNWPQGRLIVY